MLHAVIVYAHTDLLPQAYAWCAAQGWTAQYAVPKSQWRDALRLALDEELIVVVASKDSLPGDRVPRIEIVPDDHPSD